ncbi:hypothetical protein N7481_002224 [Penicillium waksmanii]|uniref:uncharacterized protein n=1 Tax=Penicillium waksmanii TaxID=69791 RepID=UPI0025494540|nr:uncharacterized protein N7481_002224 [Penicillium waksmanii]KAJ5995247.1 hypothetical protein N7481_002224 [Penicillium waksmanii]
MVRNIHIAVLDVDIPARGLYEARGLCSAHFRSILRETAAHLNETNPNIIDPINITVTPYDIRGGHFPEFHLMRGSNPPRRISLLQKFIRTVYDEHSEVRILGTCFGHQLISHALVRDPEDKVRDVYVEKCPLGREVGIYKVDLNKEFIRSFPSAFAHLPQSQMRIQMFHGDRVMAVEKGAPVSLSDTPPVSLPAPWINVGSTPICPIQGLYNPGRVLSVQGHYEMDAFGLTKMCKDAAPTMGWKESKLAVFLEQVGPDLVDQQDDSKCFATAVVSFLSDLEG